MMTTKKMMYWTVMNALLLGYSINDLIHGRNERLVFAIAMLSIAVQAFSRIRKTNSIA